MTKMTNGALQFCNSAARKAGMISAARHVNESFTDRKIMAD
jgi:hypothetical protein